ncbi:VOC family protein [Nocardia panacis]|nr:VOC family protein [Nocardia panacis]
MRDPPSSGESVSPGSSGIRPARVRAATAARLGTKGIVMTVSGTSMNLTLAAHVGISVSNLDVSIAFYQALTGRAPVASGTMHSVPFGGSQGLSAAELRYATINLDNSLGIDLIEFRNPPGEPTRGAANRPGSMHLCLRVDDFDAVYRRMKEAGYSFLGEDYTFIAGEVTPEAALGTKVAYFNDPDGTNLEIIQPKGGFAA